MPAMAAGLAQSPIEIGDLIAMIDARDAAKISAKREALLLPQSN
jgi:hypothetical protein